MVSRWLRPLEPFVTFYVQVAEKTALLRPVELKLVPVALEGSAFRTKFLDTDELLGYTSWIAVYFFCTFILKILACSFTCLPYIVIMSLYNEFYADVQR